MSFTKSISRSSSLSCLSRSPALNQEIIQTEQLGRDEEFTVNDKDKIIITYSNNMDTNNIIHRVLFSNILIYYCLSYLDLIMVGNLSLVNKQIYHIIRNTPKSLIQKLCYQTFIENVGRYMNIKEIYEHEKNKCIHSSILSKLSRISSTVFETRGYSSCKTINDTCTSDCGKHNIIYDIFPDLSDSDSVYHDLFYRDYSLYILLSSVEFGIIHSVFKDFSRYIYPLKMLLPFGFNLGNDDTMLLSFKKIVFLHFMDEIIQDNCYWNDKMQINDRSDWMCIHIKNGLIPNIVNIVDENDYPTSYRWKRKPIPMRGITFFDEYLEMRFHISKWFKFINWQNNIMCGSALLNATLSINDDLRCDDTAVDIFSYNIPYDTFIKQLNDFEESLIKHSMKYMKLVTGLCLYTFYLIDNDLSYPVKIKFVFICRFSSISSILLSFDMSCCQLAYDPSKKELLCTHVFLEFIRSGYNRLFRCVDENNLTSVHRILKYKRRGVSSFMIPRGVNIMDLENNMNDIQQDYMDEQIDCIDMKINRFSDRFRIHSSLNSYHPFVNWNVDHSHMLENVLELLFPEE